MQLITAITSAIAFMAASAIAAPAPIDLGLVNKQFTGNPFELTNLTVDRVVAGNVTLDFTIYNPDPLANATTTCSGSWPYGSGGWPSGIYKSCDNSSFAWHMKNFESWTGFTLELKDTFTDPSVGKAPYDKVTIFGTANYDTEVISCKDADGGELCSQLEGSTVRAPIDRSIAKRDA